MKNSKLTFQKIDGSPWTDEIPGPEDSYVFQKAYELYHKELGKFDAEDLRFIIGQGHYLEYVMPFAIKLLKENLIPDEKFYAGALLERVLKTDEHFWAEDPDLRKELELLFIAQQHLLDGPPVYESTKRELHELFKAFLMEE